MGKLIGLFLGASLLSVQVQAGCSGTIVMGKCHGAENDYLGSSNDSGYESNSGAQYQYDMSNPSDRRSYGYDYDAQRRDQQSADPRRKTDRDSGQYGGGIYR